MFNIAKIQKDLESLSDLVLLQEIRETAAAQTMLQRKMAMMNQEADRRVALSKNPAAPPAPPQSPENNSDRIMPEKSNPSSLLTSDPPKEMHD